MQDPALLLLATTLIASAILATRSKSLIHAAIALAAGSCSLALLFFLLQAPFAGAVQLSVGAGVVSALFIVAISLTEILRGAGHGT